MKVENKQKKIKVYNEACHSCLNVFHLQILKNHSLKHFTCSIFLTPVFINSWSQTHLTILSARHEDLVLACELLP